MNERIADRLRNTYADVIKRMHEAPAAVLATLSICDTADFQALRRALMPWRIEDEIQAHSEASEGLELPDIETFDFESVTQLVGGASSGALSEDEYIELHAELVRDYRTHKRDIIKMNEIRLLCEMIRYIDKRLDPVSIAIANLGKRYHHPREVNDPDVADILQGAVTYISVLRQFRTELEIGMFAAWSTVRNKVLKEDSAANLELLGIIDESGEFVPYDTSDTPHLAR